MTKKSLQDWYNSNDISYSEKEKLNKIGINNYDYHNLIDLQQILRCADWAQNNSEIRNKLSGRIRKIVFFTPDFNDSKPDASNYSCAIVTDSNNGNWVIIYRPSYVSNIDSDLLIEKVSNPYEIERGFNGDYPVKSLLDNKVNFESPVPRLDYLLCINHKDLPYDVRSNPEKYILPLDIISRESGIKHFAIYLGNEWVAHLTGKDDGTKFDSWHKFCNPDGSSRSLFSSFSSSGLGSGDITVHHPKIPFKEKSNVIRHVAKAVSCNYGKKTYDFAFNNCEHLANSCVLGVKDSLQSLFSTSTTRRLEVDDKWLGNLTSNYSYEKGKVEQYISEAERKRCYNHAQYRIEQEKFQERIEVNPKDWCRIS